MVIINPSIASQPAAFNRPAGPAPILPTDRVLNAVVLGQRAEHLYELASGNLRLMAESQTALRRGEQLLLQVTGNDAQQRPTLKVLTPNNSAISPLLKEMLPQQQSANQLMASLSALISNTGAQPKLAALAAELLSSLPRRQQVSDPDGLTEAIRNSGLFLESRATDGKLPPQDLKSQLLQLAQRLEQQYSKSALAKAEGQTASKLAQDYSPKLRMPADPSSLTLPSSQPANPPATPLPSHSSLLNAYRGNFNSTDLPGQMLAQGRVPVANGQNELSPEVLSKQLLLEVRGAIARQEAHQLLHLQQRDGQQAQYVVELPVRNDDGVDVWQLHLHWLAQAEEDQHGHKDHLNSRDKPTHLWRITLNFDLPGLGQISVKVQQQAAESSKLIINFSSDSDATRTTIETHQHELQSRLEAEGIHDTSILCHTGITSNSDSSFSNQALVNDSA